MLRHHFGRPPDKLEYNFTTSRLEETNPKIKLDSENASVHVNTASSSSSPKPWDPEKKEELDEDLTYEKLGHKFQILTQKVCMYV